jgi:hypothetical protein
MAKAGQKQRELCERHADWLKANRTNMLSVLSGQGKPQ